MAIEDHIRARYQGVRMPPAVDRVIVRVRDLLLSRRLRPGDKLPSEGELAELLEVSRGSVREAMKVLSSYGVVVVRAGDGTYVSTHTQGSLFDPVLFQMLLSSPDRQALSELRQMLEAGMVPLLVAHAEAADVAALRDAVARTAALVAAGSTDADALTAADRAFHQALGRASHNPLVERIYALVMDFLEPTVRDTYVSSRSGDSALRLHGAIVAALDAGDAAGLHAAVQASIAAWDALR